MTKKRVWKITRITGAVMLLLVVTLSIHIYMVTRPKPYTPDSRILARIDIKQHIDSADANKIAAWLYQQKGVDHVLCNPQTGIAVFTFHPVVTSASKIVSAFTATMPYKAVRFMPSADQMKSGCPVAATSFTYKVYDFFHHI